MDEESDQSADVPKDSGEPGERIGHYEITGPLGHGGMAIVYRARDLRLDRLVALKRPAPGHEDDPTFRKRFLREARAASKISHPNIVPVYEVFEHDGTPWLSMPLIRGQTLRECIQVRGRLPVHEILRFGQQLAEAVKAAHDEHVLHRDINPKNILINERGEALLADFGLARYFTPPEGADSATTRSYDITEAGAVVGTPGYMSPEQCLARPVDRRSDVFSLGAVLYELCTGVPPFTGNSHGELYDQILHQEPRSISTLNYEVPPELERIVRKTLAKNPDERYQDARDLIVDLRALRRQLDFESYGREHQTPAVAIEAATQVEEGRRWSRIRRVWPMLVVAVALAVLVHWIRHGRVQLEEAGVRNLSIRPLIAQTGQEFVARISPDGQWVAYSAKTGESYGLSVRRLVGGTTLPVLTDKKRITGHVWSPDGSEIAVQVLIGDESFLQMVAAFEGTVSKSIKLDSGFQDAAPIRWINDHIYFDVPHSGLWRLSLHSEEFEILQRSDVPTGKRSYFDVCSQEDRASFTVRRGEQLTVWTGDLDGANAHLMTPDGSSDFNARWAGDNCGFLVFSSLQNGQMDLCRMSIGRGLRDRLTFSSEFDYVQDASQDGHTLVTIEQQEGAQLWIVDPSTIDPTGKQLTVEDALHLWPTASPKSSTVAFQRSKPTPERMFPLFDAEIFVARLEGTSLQDVRRVVVDGGYTSLSPHVDHLAYVRQAGGELELWLQELSSALAWRVSRSFAFPRYTPFPLDWEERQLAWTIGGDGLYFVESSPDSQQIRFVSCDPESKASELVAGYPNPDRLHALHVSPDDRSLVYVCTHKLEGRSEIRHHDSITKRDRSVYSFEHAGLGRLYVLGFLPAGDALVAMRCTFNSDMTWAVELVRVDLSGGTTPIASFNQAFPSTARLDAGARRLYITREEHSGGPHNVFAVDLSDGSLRHLTSNTDTNTSFSGLETTGDGRLVFARHAKSQRAIIVQFQ